MQIITMPVPAQDGITRDNVTVRVDAVVYFRVMDPVRAAVDVQDYLAAIGQVAQTSLRSIIGKSDLDDLLSDREQLNQGMALMIDSPALGWGVHIERVEVKDVALPESMKRSMSRQAEAERERRARVITANGELQASQELAQAAEVMAEHPAALQLRLLQTVVEVAAERNSTLVLPFPVELLRFLERTTPPEPTRVATNGSVPRVERQTAAPPAPALVDAASGPTAGPAWRLTEHQMPRLLAGQAVDLPESPTASWLASAAELHAPLYRKNSVLDFRCMDLGSRAAGIGALGDDTRRALYEYVTSQPEPVGASKQQPPWGWRCTTWLFTSTGW